MYPVSFEQDYTEPRNRLTTFFRYFMVIPLFFVGIFWGVAAFFTIIASWVIVSATGAYPPGLYDFNAKVLRFSARLNGYFYLLTDTYPPFDGDEHADYPVRVQIGPAKAEYSRLKAFFRIIVGIPVLLMSYLYGILLGVVPILSWLAIVITGKQPQGLQDLTAMGSSYQAKATAYFMLMTEDYPPITDARTLDAGGTSAQLGAS